MARIVGRIEKPKKEPELKKSEKVKEDESPKKVVSKSKKGGSK